MRAPVEWIAEFADIVGVSEEFLSEKLTQIGLEVEEVDESGPGSVLVTKVTPNRGDWMSIVGVAREAAAALDCGFSGAAPAKRYEPGAAAALASAVVEQPQWCPRFALRVIKNVRPVSSPDFMQERLNAAGMRSISLAVDITNYVMLELGQPMHAYDYDKLPGGQIIVRAAKPGEVIVTLDGVKRSLTSDNLVIADRTHAIGIAGIMGGSETEVSDETATVLLEAAHFDAGVIRRASKALGLTTEASYRFERYVDPALVMIAQERACELFEKYGGATIVDGAIDSNPDAAVERLIPLRPERANALLGEKLTASEMAEALARLQIEPESAGSLTFRIPSFRPDIVAETDLIEEIGRVVGYENLPETLPAIGGGGGGDYPIAAFDSRLRSLLIGQGLTEVFTHSLGATSAFDDPAEAGARVRVRTALSADLSTLRQSLIPNLLHVMAANLRHRQPDARIFEVGKTYITAGSGKYTEPRRVAGVFTGGGSDYAAAKGAVENVLEALHIVGARFTPAEVHGMHPGRCAAVSAGSRRIGFVAEVEPDLVKSALDVPASVGRVALFELSADVLRELASDAEPTRYAPPPRFPAISRDLSLLFDDDAVYGEIEETAREAGGPLLESAALLSVYAGEHVPHGKKSIALRLTLRAADRTLTDSDADSVISRIQSRLMSTLSGEARV